MRCITTTSSQPPNLRPTSRSVPTTVNPTAWCSPIDALVPVGDAGDHGVEAPGLGHPHHLLHELLAEPFASRRLVHVHAGLHRGPVGGPGPVLAERGEPQHLAGDFGHHTPRAPSRSRSHACWSANERGTRSKVWVVCSTSWL